MKAHPVPSSRASALAYPMATAKPSSRPNQRQRLTHTERGNSLGLCAPILAVVHVQDRPALTLRAGITPRLRKTCRGPSVPGLSRIQNPTIDRSGFLPRPVGQLRGCAVKAAPRYFHSMRVSACKPVCAQLLQDEHPQYRALPVIKHPSALSSSSVSVGIDPNENGLTHAQTSFAPGAKAND